MTTRERKSGLWASLILILVSVLCAVPGSSYFVVWLVLKVTTGYPPPTPSLDTLKWVVWGRDRGMISLPFSVTSVIAMAAASRVGSVRFYVWLAPALAILGTLSFWLGMYLDFTD